MTEPCLDSYYFSFDKTGIPVIDKILAAVAVAGKAFHSTDQWNDIAKCTWLDGDTPVKWIQSAANDAAREVGFLETQLDNAYED